MKKPRVYHVSGKNPDSGKRIAMRHTFYALTPKGIKSVWRKAGFKNIRVKRVFRKKK